MSNCIICHREQICSPVICPACLAKLQGKHHAPTETATALRELAARVGYVDEGTLAMWLYRAAAELERCAQPEQENKALTVEELRGMDGEPVWVKSGGRVLACIVQKQHTLNTNVFAHGFHDYDGIRLVHDVTFTFMASDVDCYRRPPEKE